MKGAPEVQSPRGNGAKAEHNPQNSPAIVADLDADRKAFCTLSARLALKGFGVYELASGGYLVSRWDRSLHCSDLAGVRTFYERCTGGSV